MITDEKNFIRMREQIREAVLITMAKQPTRVFSTEALARSREVRDFVSDDFDESHVNDALALLVGYGLAKEVDRPLSGLRDFQITAAGVIFRERNYGR